MLNNIKGEDLPEYTWKFITDVLGLRSEKLLNCTMSSVMWLIELADIGELSTNFDIKKIKSEMLPYIMGNKDE